MKPCRTTEEFGGNRLTQKLLRNGVKTTFDYDDHIVGDENQGMNRITDIKHFKTVAEEDDELLIHLQWPREEYDPLGNRLRMNRVKFPFVGGQFGSGSYVKYAYDKTSQLLSERHFLANDTEFLKQEVPAAGGYDNAGNRLRYDITDHGAEKQLDGDYDLANQLNALHLKYPALPDQEWETTYENDQRGNRTQKIQSPGAGQEAETWDYTFNIFNKLTTVERERMGVNTECGFKYGADGYRVEKELGAQASLPVKRLYIMDGVHVIMEKEIVGEGEPVTKVRYIPGVCMITKDNEENEVVRYYHEDALGSFIAMTDEHQNLTALYQYDAWGNELLPQVSALSPLPSENPYRWCGTWGYYRDADAQMYLLGMRWYDVETGRFLTRDPIGFAAGDMNQFRPMGNNPVNEMDPWGLQFRDLNEDESAAVKTAIGKVSEKLPKLGAKLYTKLERNEIRVDTQLGGAESGRVNKLFNSEIIYLAPDLFQYEDLLINILVHEYVHTQQFGNIANKTFWILADELRFLYDLTIPGMIHRTARRAWSLQAIFHDDKPSEMMAERLANEKFPKP